MIYNQDEENFLSDKKVGQKQPQEETRRRGGAYAEEDNKPKKIEEQSSEEESSVLNIILIVVAIIVIIIAVLVMIKVLNVDDKEDSNISDNTVVTDNKNEATNENDSNKTNTNNNKENSGLAISSTNENYDAYPIEIKSVVDKKGGKFYNNNIGIKGDKVYVEYKQIDGLKDTQKQEKINEMLKKLSVELYDKNYLSDENTLFVDIHTKLSVNFNTLSYIVYRTGQDIDGKDMANEIKTLNLRLDTLEEVDFEDLFTDNFNIKQLYSNYVKDKVMTFYYDPNKIYVYDKDLKETIIDMQKNYSNIAIYKRYNKSNDLFKGKSVSKKVFTVLDSTVSEETKDRAFEKTK